MLSTLRYAAAVLAAAVLLAAMPSCGANLQFGVLLTEDLFGDLDVGLVIHDGDWRGDYVYYRGRWYLNGYGTPYYDRRHCW